MNARDELLDEYGRADTAPLGALADLRRKLDAYRAEVLREAALIFVNACPDGDSDYAFMLCQCDAADELRRMAAAADRGGTGHCTAEYGGSGYTRCERAAGHDGHHESALGNLRRATWGGGR